MWPFGRSARLRSTIALSDPAVIALLGYGSLGTNSITESTALTLSAFYRGLSIVSGSIAGLPLRTIEKDSAGRTAPVGSWLDNPVPDRTPGTVRMTPFEFKEFMVLCLMLHGDVFLQHLYNGAGALVGVWPIHPLNVSVCWDASRPGGKRYDVTTTHERDGAVQTTTEHLDASNLTQIMGMSLNGLRGISCIAASRQSLGTALAGDKAANRMVSNGAMIAGMVTPAEEDLTGTEAAEAKDVINKLVAGPEHAGDIPVFSKKLVFSPWQMNAVDAQFIEGREFNISEIARWTGVPANLLMKDGAVSTWGAGVEIVNRGLSRYTLRGYTDRIQERLSIIVPQRSRYAEFDYGAFNQASPEQQSQQLVAEMNGGLITPNEARAARNLLPVAGGDTLRTPAGSAPTPAVPAGPPALPELTP